MVAYVYNHVRVIWSYVSACRNYYLYYLFLIFYINEILFLFLYIYYLFHQSLSANCALPTMYKGEAYISVSLLLPSFSSQSETL